MTLCEFLKFWGDVGREDDGKGWWVMEKTEIVGVAVKHFFYANICAEEICVLKFFTFRFIIRSPLMGLERCLRG